jgi:hypothetical protein
MQKQSKNNVIFSLPKIAASPENLATAKIPHTSGLFRPILARFLSGIPPPRWPQNAMTHRNLRQTGLRDKGMPAAGNENGNLIV